MGFIERLKNNLQMQKEKELAKQKRGSKAWEAQKAADERVIKRARECLEASSFPRLARELAEFIGTGVHIEDTREVAEHFGISSADGATVRDAREEIAVGKLEAYRSREDGGNAPRRVKPYICMEINWDYEYEEVRDWKPGNPGGHGIAWYWAPAYRCKHIGIHFEEDWKIHVIGGPHGVATLSKNKWYGKQREQEKALEKAYLHPAELTSRSLPNFMK